MSQVGTSAMAQHEELLVVRAVGPHPHVQQALPPGRLDRPGRDRVLLGREPQRRGLRAPEQPADVHPAPGRARQHRGDAGVLARPQTLVGVHAPAREHHQVARAGRLQRRPAARRSSRRRAPGAAPGCRWSRPRRSACRESRRVQGLPRSVASRNQSAGGTTGCLPARTPSGQVPGARRWPTTCATAGATACADGLRASPASRSERGPDPVRDNGTVLSAMAPARRTAGARRGRSCWGRPSLVARDPGSSSARCTARPPPPRRRAVPQDQPGPVLLVPGYGGSVSELNQLAAALRCPGQGRHRRTAARQRPGRPARPGPRRSLRQRPRHEPAPARPRWTWSATPPAGWWPATGCRTSAGAAQTRRLVTLGLAAPRHRDRRAGHAVRRRVPGRLPAAAAHQPAAGRPGPATEPQGGPRVVSIWTTQDDVVLPPDSARLAGALNLTVQSVCPGSQGAPRRPAHRPAGAGHGQRRARAPGRPQQLGSADCRRLSS